MSEAASAKMALAFASLTGGVRFDGKRHRDDMKLFRRGGGGGESASGGSAAPVESGRGADAGKKRKRVSATDAPPNLAVRESSRGARGDDDAIDVFEASRGVSTRAGASTRSRSSEKEDAKRAKKKTASAVDAASSRALASSTSVLSSREIEAANVARKRWNIRVSGAGAGHCPAPLRDFADLVERYDGAGRRLLARLGEAGFAEPTPIQRQAVPLLLEGNDLLAVAPTGSGKTLAFLLPILVGLSAGEGGDRGGRARKGPRALLLSPAKELAQQSFRVLKLLARGTGGSLRCCLLTKATQMNEMDKVDVLVATPLRLKTLIERSRVDLGSVTFLVLDEADKLFEMGFVDQVDAAVAACANPKCARALFSATLPETVERMARSVMPSPIRLTIGERNAAAATVAQSLVFCGEEKGKLLALRALFAEGLKPPAIVFTQSKDRAKQLARELSGDGLRLGLVHAGMSDGKRQAQVDRLRAGDTWVLIATDLMARGMDFVGVSAVVNYDFPGSAHSYVHRIGRSGRAGRPGRAITLFTEEDAERGDVRVVARVMRNSGCEVPEWLLATGSRDPGMRRRRRADGREDNPRREAIDPGAAARNAAAMKAREKERRAKRRMKAKEARRGGDEGR